MIACAHRMRFVCGAWQGTEGATNPATRPLVKSLMKVLSFLMGRRRKVVPKAMRKKVLMLVLQMLDLKSPTEVAIATYMTKNLVHGRRAADEFLLDWAEVVFVEKDGEGTMPCFSVLQEDGGGAADETDGDENDGDESGQIEVAPSQSSVAPSTKCSVIERPIRQGGVGGEGPIE